MSRPRVAHFSPLLFFSLLLPSGRAPAQTPADSLAALTVRLAAMSGVTGYEQAVADTLLRLLPGSGRDPLGNVVRPAPGSRRLVACPMDEPGWIVGGVRPDGWVTVRRTPGPPAPLRDQQLEGARVTVYGRRGPVPGVVAVRSIHLTRGRGDLTDGPFTADSALLDLGAASAEEVSRLGVAPLAPVTLAKRPHAYGGRLLAGPWVARRAACAAVLLAALERGASAAVAFVVQQELSGRGLAAVARRAGPFEETLIVDGGAGDPGALRPTPAAEPASGPPELGRIARLTLPARYAGSPVETVSLDDVRALAAAIGAWIGEAR